MRSNMRPIQTHYAGCRFRSRLEARWAVFFDHLNIAWDYEKQGYDLGDAGPYLPDFWLEDLEIWFEVKGEHGLEDYDKARALREATGFPVVIATGQIGRTCHYVFSYEVCDSGGGEYEAAGLFAPLGERIIIAVEVSRSDRELCQAWCTQPATGLAGFPRIAVAPPIQRAFDAARSARFEHGEKGYRR